MDKKLENLIAYCQGMYRHENGIMLYNKYLKEIKSITPAELMFIQNEQLNMGLKIDDILPNVDKLINVFYESLSQHKLAEPITIPFLKYLDDENKGLVKILESFKKVMKEKPLVGNQMLRAFLDKVKKYNQHLLKLENVFFPMLEKGDKRFNGLKILWALHDEERGLIKKIESEWDMEGSEEFLKLNVSRLYFILYGLVNKQELILFPSSVNFLTNEAFYSMHMQSFDYSFCFIAPPESPAGLNNSQAAKAVAGLFNSDTGQLKLDELELLLNALPMDISFVNADDKLTYFSSPEKRIFPRSKAAIGRDVRNCHPPKSVHIVEKILAAFKSGEKDDASFWLNVAGEMIYIKYIALRSASGEYMGTVEIVQAVDDIRALQGERRLLEWEDDKEEG
ncbi:MAG: DUF438 domain-containing protein [Clostridia bacterium]|nr:DUF438 domain-containing protein [Clostridia bacterium]